MNKPIALTATLFISALIVTSLAFAEPRTPVQQSPEMQSPGRIEAYPARPTMAAMSPEAPKMTTPRKENAEPRTPVQQSPEMQTPGMMEVYPAGLR